jgi:hypothetical protein
VAVGSWKWGEWHRWIDRISAVILIPDRDVWQQCGRCGSVAGVTMG